MTKSIFGVHDPVGLRYLFQLRVRLSPLRSHKSHHNFIDTLLTSANVIKVLKIQVISYSFVLYIFLKEPGGGSRKIFDSG